jgi:hypothetical protein
LVSIGSNHGLAEQTNAARRAVLDAPTPHRPSASSAERPSHRGYRPARGFNKPPDTEQPAH